MNYDNGGLSASDVALLTGNKNNDGGFGDNSCWWIILLLLALGGWNNGGFGGGFGGNYGGTGNEYAWLSNGQKEIMQNTNDGFNSLHISNQIEGVRDGIHDIQNAICNSTASINSNVSNGFYNAEIGANNRQMANMQQAFNSQIATMQGFNTLGSQFADCLTKILKKAKEIFSFTKYKTVGSLVG